MANKKYVIIENNSKVYFNGSIWNSNNCGKFMIMAKKDDEAMENMSREELQKLLDELE